MLIAWRGGGSSYSCFSSKSLSLAEAEAAAVGAAAVRDVGGGGGFCMTFLVFGALTSRKVLLEVLKGQPLLTWHGRGVGGTGVHA